jgi:hypothetical protein
MLRRLKSNANKNNVGSVALSMKSGVYSPLRCPLRRLEPPWRPCRQLLEQHLQQLPFPADWNNHKSEITELSKQTMGGREEQ